MKVKIRGSITGKTARVNPCNISRDIITSNYYISFNIRNIVKFKNFILENWNTFKYVQRRRSYSEASVPSLILLIASGEDRIREDFSKKNQYDACNTT